MGHIGMTTGGSGSGSAGCTIIIGAGASLDFTKDLSTESLTATVLEAPHLQGYGYDEAIRILGDVHRLLANEAGGGASEKVSFEHMSQYLLNILSSYEEWPGIDTVPDMLIPRELINLGLNEETCRMALYVIQYEVYEAVLSHRHCSCGKLDGVSGFVNAIEFFRHPDVFNLNYDDLVDTVFKGYNDGFLPNGEPELRSFDEKLAVSPDKPVYNHLHGSIHLTRYYIEVDDRRPFRWFIVPPRHIGEIDKMATQDRRLVLHSPMIIGLDKLNGLMHDPFRSYHANLIRCMNKNDRLITIGYGFGDTYINALIHSFLRREGTKMLNINPCGLPEGRWSIEEREKVIESMRGFGEFCDDDACLRMLVSFFVNSDRD